MTEKNERKNELQSVGSLRHIPPRRNERYAYRAWRHLRGGSEVLIVEDIKAISFQERAGKPGGGKGILIQEERTGALSTLTNQYVCYSPRELLKSRGEDEKDKSICG